jgi:DNA processing protein
MREALLALHFSGAIGVVLYRRLVDFAGSAEQVSKISEPALQRIPGIGPVTAREIARSFRERKAQREGEHAKREGIHIVTFEEEGYPEPLKTIFDPPLALSIRGEYKDPLAVAMVGSRKCSAYGLRQADRFGQELSSLGVTVVSGLARGIDTASHKGALRNGRTIAVLGSGLSHIYPYENGKLAMKIAEQGCVMSEFGAHTPPHRIHFPRRNRIVSGLSLGTLVIEAAEKSGALLTADWALEQGREIFCLPGSVENPVSRGCHKLIKQGAALVETPIELLESIPAIAAQIKRAL